MNEKHYRFTVPTAYHCDGHTPGEVLTVRLIAEEEGNPGWFYAENIHDGDQFPVRMDELTPIL